MRSQRGGFAMGLVAGLLIGLALALGVALYITKAPIPFMNKVPQRTAEMDTAEALRNRNWDPNAALGGRTAGRAASAAAAGAAAASGAAPVLPEPPAAAASRPAGAGVAAAPAAASAARPAARDPAAILAGEAPSAPARSTAAGAEPFVYFVQAGAFTRNEEAEQQRARLALMGQGAKITEREQAGRTVYRVRMGPYPTRGEADALQVKLQEQGIEAQLVRVEKP
jgi:cell division protein FtsN